jgi:uncharacterized protein (DUF2141 family)
MLRAQGGTDQALQRAFERDRPRTTLIFERVERERSLQARTRRRVLSMLALSATCLVGLARASCPGIHVTILNIRNSIGTVDCALFDSSSGFPTDTMRSAMRLTAMKVPERTARCDFEDLPAGKYALVVLHDENMNGRIDYNWLGIPREGYGFSNDARGTLGAPSFEKAAFVYDGKTLELSVSLRY